MRKTVITLGGTFIVLLGLYTVDQHQRLNALRDLGYQVAQDEAANLEKLLKENDALRKENAALRGTP